MNGHATIPRVESMHTIEQHGCKFVTADCLRGRTRLGVMGYEMQSSFMYHNKPLVYNTIPFQNISERAVEIPIVIDFLKEAGKEKRILEVGNVLSNYTPLLAQHSDIGKIDVLDKFEQGNGIINVDVMDFNTPYDVIVSISTVEHIGQNAYGEKSSGDREAPLKAVLKMYQLLNPGGKALITVPFGKLMDLGWLIQFSSEYLDLLVGKYGIPQEAIKTTFLKKLDADTSIEAPQQLWNQCEAKELENTYFHSPFPYANGIAVIQLEKGAEPRFPHTDQPEPLPYRPPLNIGDFYYSPFVKPFGFDLNGWFSVSQPGLLFYGPNVALEPQVYRFEAAIEIVGQGHFTLEITSNFGEKVLWKTHLSQSASIQDLLPLPAAEHHVEVRLSKHDEGNCSLRVPKMFLGQLEGKG
jgi:SAM-dependent methyltransferase